MAMETIRLNQEYSLITDAGWKHIQKVVSPDLEDGYNIGKLKAYIGVLMFRVEESSIATESGNSTPQKNKSTSAASIFMTPKEAKSVVQKDNQVVTHNSVRLETTINQPEFNDISQRLTHSGDTIMNGVDELPSNDGKLIIRLKGLVDYEKDKPDSPFYLYKGESIVKPPGLSLAGHFDGVDDEGDGDLVVIEPAHSSVIKENPEEGTKLSVKFLTAQQYNLVTGETPEAACATLVKQIGQYQNILIASKTPGTEMLFRRFMNQVSLEIIEKRAEVPEMEPGPGMVLEPESGDEQGGGANIDITDQSGQLLSKPDIDLVERDLALQHGIRKLPAEFTHDFTNPELKDTTFEIYEFIYDHLDEIQKDFEKNYNKTLSDLFQKFYARNDRKNRKKMFSYEWEYFKTILDYVMNTFSKKEEIANDLRIYKFFLVESPGENNKYINKVMEALNNHDLLKTLDRAGYIKKYSAGSEDKPIEHKAFLSGMDLRPISATNESSAIDIKSIEWNAYDSGKGFGWMAGPLIEQNGRKLTNDDGVYTLETYMDFFTKHGKKEGTIAGGGSCGKGKGPCVNGRFLGPFQPMDPSPNPKILVDGVQNPFLTAFLKSNKNHTLSDEDEIFVKSFFLNQGVGLNPIAEGDYTDITEVLGYISKQAAISTMQFSINKLEITGITVTDVYFTDAEVTDGKQEKEHTSLTIVIEEQKDDGTNEPKSIIIPFVNVKDRNAPFNSISEITTALQDQVKNGKHGVIVFGNVGLKQYLQLKPPSLSTIGDKLLPPRPYTADIINRHYQTKLLFFMMTAKSDGDSDQIEFLYNYTKQIDSIIGILDDYKKGKALKGTPPTVDETRTIDEIIALLEGYKNGMFIGTVDKNVFAHALLLHVYCFLTNCGVKATFEMSEKYRHFFDLKAFEQIVRILSIDMTDHDESEDLIKEAINRPGMTGPERDWNSLRCLTTYTHHSIEGIDYKVKTNKIIAEITTYAKKIIGEGKYGELIGLINGVFSPPPQDDKDKETYFAYRILFEDMHQVVDFHATVESIINACMRTNEIIMRTIPSITGRDESARSRMSVAVKDQIGIIESLGEIYETYMNTFKDDKYKDVTVNVGNLTRIRTLLVESSNKGEMFKGFQDLLGKKTEFCKIVTDAIEEHVENLNRQMDEIMNGTKRISRSDSVKITPDDFIALPEIKATIENIKSMDTIITRIFYANPDSTITSPPIAADRKREAAKKTSYRSRLTERAREFYRRLRLPGTLKRTNATLNRTEKNRQNLFQEARKRLQARLKRKTEKRIVDKQDSSDSNEGHRTMASKLIDSATGFFKRLKTIGSPDGAAIDRGLDPTRSRRDQTGTGIRGGNRGKTRVHRSRKKSVRKTQKSGGWKW